MESRNCNKLKAYLKDNFGPTFRPGQLEIIETISKENVLSVINGCGKISVTNFQQFTLMKKLL